MSASERSEAVRQRLREKLGKAPETEQDRAIAEALRDPAKFLKSVDPQTVKKALDMMQDLPQEGLEGEAGGAVLAAMQQRAALEGADGRGGEQGAAKTKKKKRKRKKKKNTVNAEGGGSEAPPPLPL